MFITLSVITVAAIWLQFINSHSLFWALAGALKGCFRFAGNQVYRKKNQGSIGGEHQLSPLKLGTPGWVIDQYLGIGEPLKVWPWPCLGQNFLKYIPCLGPSILLPCLGQRTKWTPFVLKPFIGNCKRARYVIVIAFVYLENKQNSSRESNQSCRKYPVDKHSRNHIPFGTERWKTIPCPAAHSRSV